MKRQDIHIGCSAYNNSYWKNVFYPPELPRAKWFAYYCEHFGTYELNATFYRFPTLKSLQDWHQKSPDGFIFAVKAPKHITHIKRFRDCKKEIADFYSVCREGLAEKLGCILFQLPPSFAFSEENLELVVGSMSPDFKNTIEFRHQSWWMPKVYETLAAKNIIFCSVSYPKLPDTVIVTAAIVYIRLHGREKLFYSGYADDELQDLYKQAASKNNTGGTFIYFNNTASAAGILNALALKEYISDGEIF